MIEKTTMRLLSYCSDIRGPQTRQKARATSIPCFHIMNWNFSHFIKLENSEISNYPYSVNSYEDELEENGRIEINLTWRR